MRYYVSRWDIIMEIGYEDYSRTGRSRRKGDELTAVWIKLQFLYNNIFIITSPSSGMGDTFTFPVCWSLASFPRMCCEILHLRNDCAFFTFFGGGLFRDDLRAASKRGWLAARGDSEILDLFSIATEFNLAYKGIPFAFHFIITFDQKNKHVDVGRNFRIMSLCKERRQGLCESWLN